MNKLNQTQILNLLALLFVVVVGIGFITMKTNTLKYKLSAKETLAQMAEGPAGLAKAQALQLLDNPGADVRFIDIRSTDKYQKGHVKDAINIPERNLTDPENLAVLKDSAYTVVLYGDNKVQAYGPWLLFRQMGMNHVQFIPGSYDGLAGAFSFPDSAKYDYKKIFDESLEAAQGAATATAPPAEPKPKKAIVPSPVKKPAAAQAEEGC
ncbi:MAG: rhodanese-like domain-containing protein [Lewinellaceae bacterium]|nr:rhodanese-like domain-containing protein [Lewinellaceae bacterium]